MGDLVRAWLPLPAREVTLASRADRFFGQMVDSTVGGAPLAAAFFLSSHGLALVGGPLFLIGGAWWLFYNLFADGFQGGQSLGKRWLGTQVIDATTGAPCSFGQSFVRNALQILGPLDWIFIVGDARQRLGDKAAGTIVVTD